MAITVFLAEDHRIVREGTRQLLELSPDLVVVGEAADGDDALRQCARLQPDVVVLDVRMPGASAEKTTRRLKQLTPPPRVLILTAYEDDQYVFPLLEAGADGYLLKTTSGQDLVMAILTVQAGRKVLDPAVTDKVVAQATSRPASPLDRLPESLTDRERQVLRAAADGLGNKEISLRLGIGISTVQVHLRNIFSKLGANSRTEAVTLALRQGILRLDDEPAAQ